MDWPSPSAPQYARLRTLCTPIYGVPHFFTGPEAKILAPAEPASTGPLPQGPLPPTFEDRGDPRLAPSAPQRQPCPGTAPEPEDASHGVRLRDMTALAGPRSTPSGARGSHPLSGTSCLGRLVPMRRLHPRTSPVPFYPYFSRLESSILPSSLFLLLVHFTSRKEC